MDRICCIIDMEGFTVKFSKNNGLSYRTKFFIRELGYIRIGSDEVSYPANSYRFNLRGHLADEKCFPDDWKTMKYQSLKVIGLPVYSTEEERAMDYREKYDIIKYVYDQCRQENLDVVAYKGGNWENYYLTKLGIPCINLETLGCPKYEKLVEHARRSDCGYHILAKNNALVHCAEAEVAAFRNWLVSRRSDE